MRKIIRYTLFLVILTRCSVDLLPGQSTSEGGISLGAVFNLAVLSIGLLSLVMKNRPSFRVPLTIWCPYLLMVMFALTYAPDFAFGLRLFLNLSSYAAIFLATIFVVNTENDMATLLKLMLVSSFVPLVVGLVQYAAGIQNFEGRIESTFPHPNVYSFYLICVITALMYFVNAGMAGKSSFWRFLPLVLLPLLVVSLVLTKTRSAWAAAALIMVVYAIAVNRKYAFVLLAAPLLLFVPAVSERLGDLEPGNEIEMVDLTELSRGVSLNSYAWRKVLWNYALEDSANARILGKGTASFHYYGGQFFPLAGGESTDAHSGFVQALYETGVVGLILFFWIYIGAAVAVWRRRGALKRQLFIIVLMFVAANFFFNYSDNVPYYLVYNWYVWAFLGGDLALRSLPSSVDRLSHAQRVT